MERRLRLEKGTKRSLGASVVTLAFGSAIAAVVIAGSWLPLLVCSGVTALILVSEPRPGRTKIRSQD